MNRHMVRLAKILVLLAVFNICFPQTSAAQTENDDRVLQDALVLGIAMGLPCLSIAIGVGDSIAWAGTAGYSDLINKVPVKTNDRFGVGSITKTFVASVILQLAEEGNVDLDKTAADYVDLDIVRDVPNADKATLRQLLNHQSGVPTWEFEKNWIHKGRGDQFEIGKIWGKTETLRYVSSELVGADFKPGLRYAYSNTNYTLLGLVVEAVTGNDAAAEIRDRIFKTLRMENTFLESFEDIPGGYVHHYHYATPQFEEVAGIHKSFREIRPYVVETTTANLSPEWTAGGMVSSASDLVRWAQAIRNGTLLGPEMQKEVFAYYPPVEPGNGRVEYMQGVMKINNFYKGHSVYGHSGGTLGFTAMMYWLEDTDIIVVMLTNVGRMHSGISPSPVSMFYKEALLPAVMEYLKQ